MTEDNNKPRMGVGLWRQLPRDPKMEKYIADYYSKPLHQRVGENLDGQELHNVFNRGAERFLDTLIGEQ